MRYIGTFDPTSVGNGYINVGSANVGDKVLLTNLSAVNIQLNFEDGHTDVLHAGQANYWILEDITPQIVWTQKSVLNVVATPKECDVVLYDANETISGTYPVSLIYFTIVANPLGVNTNVSGTASALINDGQPVGTQYIESTPTGQTQSSFTLTNDGLMALKTLVGASYKNQIQTSNTGNSPILGNSGTTSEVAGNLLVDGTLNVTGTSTLGVVNSGVTSTTNLSASGTLQVTGTSTLGTTNATNLSASGTLQVTGTSTLGVVNSGVTSTTNLSASGTLTVTGSTSLGATSATSVSASGTLQVSGTSTLGVVNSSTLTVTGTISSSSTIFSGGNLDMQTNIITHVNTIADTGGTSYLAVTPGGTTRIQGATSLSFQVPGGTTVASADSSGLHASRINLATGSFSRVTKGTATLTAAGVTVTHGLGTTPDIVLLICQAGPSTATNSVASLGATTFVGYSNSSLSYIWLAIAL
jgi:hypothetical protein